MRARRIVVAIVGSIVLGTVYLGDVVAQEDGGKGRAPRTLGKASADQAVSVPKSKIEQYAKDMDAAHEETLRIVEGGQFNVNLRRVRKAEARPSTQPKTINVWYVVEGSGAVTTGGAFANGKVTGGVTDRLNPGDVLFVPANLPTWLSEVGPNGITWLNTRWGVDWNGPMGAGSPPVPGVAGSPPAFGVAGEYAAPDRAVFLPKAKLDTYIADQNARKNASQTARMVEGGHFNVNIRNITEPSIEFHATTIDTWVVLQGAGTASTGFSTDKGGAHAETGRDAKRIDNTGVDTPMAVGDVMFVPSDFTHGFSKVDGRMVWLNIRWDSNY
jgi:mannose-6-phosphate isomerase-like protein (cupin superfamily)